ncbi:flagellin [Aneurinibacillus aneurinilyticus]|uniref:Flagellin n=2 Tax=Aneurinibacillus aneurinilyticus TaxID=1391 RepID=A0A848CWF2_ANEAE|nr:flagellin [Aneurinibacillus aneurinilyticus]NME99815.1 flagellin [Aneurinibacillus aneurinilyticus]
MIAYRSYQYHLKMQGLHMERIATGQRINRAADDPAGLAISERMRAQIRGLNMAARNAQDTISLVQTAEGALQGTHDILQRMRELTVQAGNGTLSSSDRQAIIEEMKQLEDEINRISKDTQFNSQNLLDGSFTDKAFQIGANQGQSIGISIDASDTGALGIKNLHEKLKTPEGASEALGLLDEAIKRVSSQRSQLGAYENRLEHTINNLMNSAENLAAAESRIRDADIAKEMMAYAKHSILAQAAQAMMVQARQQAEWVLELLKPPERK